MKQYWRNFSHSIRFPRSKPNLKDAIPEVFHYINYGCPKFDFPKFLSMYSVYKYSSPNSLIVYHTDCDQFLLNTQKFFSRLKIIIGERLIIQPIDKLTSIFNQELERVEHQSDVYRLLILIKYGGVYVDNDLVFLKPHDVFLNSTLPVVGRESWKTVANGFIMTPPNSNFLLRILSYYGYEFNPDCWACSSTKLYYDIAVHYTDEVHIEYNTLCVPNWKDFKSVVNVKFSMDWSGFYNFHFSTRDLKKLGYRIDQEISQFDCMRNTLGELVRYVLNDSPFVCGLNKLNE